MVQIMTFFCLYYDGVFFVFAILELVGLFFGLCYVILLRECHWPMH